MSALVWTPPENVGSDEPGYYSHVVGAFLLMAWPDGFWAIALAETGAWITECVDKADGLEQAQSVVDAKLRGMVLATAAGLGLLRVEVRS